MVRWFRHWRRARRMRVDKHEPTHFRGDRVPLSHGTGPVPRPDQRTWSDEPTEELYLTLPPIQWRRDVW